MTTTATEKSKRKPWWLLAVAILAIGGIVAAAVAMTAEDDDSNASREPSPGSIGDPESRQAQWQFTVQRGPGERFSKKQRNFFVKQRKKLKAMTREVFDALFLSPEKQSAALRASFTADARRSYQRAGAGVARKAEDVKVRWRSARIVIERNTRATMDVKIRERGKADQGTFATEHHSVLYVARGKDGWKVFGFKVDQKPIKKNKASDKDDTKRNEPRSKASKKGPKNKKDEKGKKRSGGKNRKGDRS